MLSIEAGQSASIRLRLTALTGSASRSDKAKPLGQAFDRALEDRRADADQFYEAVIPPTLCDDSVMVMRQALAGLLWGKQVLRIRRPPLAA